MSSTISERNPTWNPWEHRPDHEYDDHWPATVIHPNGSLICGVDRLFLGPVAREVLAAREGAENQ